MKRKLISYICLMAIFMESVPVNALSNLTSEVIPLESLEESTEQEDENLENNGDSTEVKEDNQDDLQGTESKPKLEDNVFNMYILDKIDDKAENELGFSIGFDEKESKFTLSNQSDKQLSTENLDTIIYKINIYDKENKEKLNIELLGSDTGNSEKLNILNQTKYEIGDTIKITSIDPKNGLKILGEIKGDINKEKQTDKEDEKVEDYSNGVDNLDYIDNVRFEITETNLKTVYNEAPVFEGLDKADENLNGLKVTDDHDGIIPNSSVVITQEGDFIVYTVTDSWGRVTQASKAKVDVYTENEQPPPTTNTLADNTITVKGIEFNTGNTTNDIRFKINFNPSTQRITITDRDGKIFSANNREYFRFALHGANGKVKHEVKLNGRDRSDSEKLDAIDNISYEVGDYISIWHEESDNKLNISGQVADVDTPNASHDFTNGVPKTQLARRFRLTATGLQLVTNRPPVIQGADIPLEVKRGDKSADLLQGISASDELDGDIPKSEIKISGVDVEKSGIYQAKYEVVDSWGEVGTATREIRVHDTNNIDGFKVDVMRKNGKDRLFTIGFDELTKEIRISNKIESGSIDPSNTKDSFILKIYNKFGNIKKTFKIKGNSDVNSNVIASIDRYKYVEGDYISLWAANKESGIKINGSIDADKLYQNIQDEDILSNVRFQLFKGSVTANYNYAPSIRGAGTKTLIRGERFNPLEGVSVADDRDSQTELTNDNIRITYERGITAENIHLQKGNHIVTYKLKDSWGRETVVNRTVIVNPRSELEKNEIVLKSNIESLNGYDMLKIGFDTLNNHLTVNYSNIGSYIVGNEQDSAFKLTIYNENQEKKDEYELRFDKSLTTDDVDKINSMSYAEGDSIALEAYDPENGIAITGSILTPEATYDNGFNHEDEFADDIMLNTRFKISKEGLDDDYNQAPIFIGLDDDVTVVKGRQFDLREGVSVEDEDENLEFTIENEELFNTSQIGTYTLTYWTVDSFGRYAMGERIIHVVAEYTDTQIELKNSNNDILLSIGINRFGSGFVLNNPTNEPLTLTNGKTTKNSSSDKKESSIIFKLTTFDRNNKQISEFILRENDIIDDEKIAQLENISLRQGYTFSIWASNHNNLMVKGHIDKETIEPNEDFSSEDYNDGISTQDLMVNVRFSVGDENLKVLYNAAPTLTIENNDGEDNNDIVLYRGESIDFTKNITVNDDRDTLDISNIKVKIGDEEATKEKLEELSESTTNSTNYQGTLKYEITDKWGRTSQTYTRNIIIKPGMERYTIQFKGRSGSSNGVELFHEGFKFKFNTDTMKFQILHRENATMSFNNLNDMYTFEILDSSGTRKGYWDFDGANNVTNAKFNNIETTDIQYGDIIKFTTTQSPTLLLSGEMYNTHNNYSNGVPSGHQMKCTEFVITKNGLVENFEESLTVSPNKNKISIITGYVGDIYLNFELNTDTRRLEVTERGAGEPLEYRSQYRSNPIVRFEFMNPNGQSITEFDLIGDNRNDNSGVQGRFTNYELPEGSYFRMLPRTEEHKKLLRILGDLETVGDVENYSDGVDNIAEMENTRFYIKSNGGFVAVHNKAPEINVPNEVNGVVNIPVGVSFDKDANVTATDDLGKIVRFSSSGDVNVNELGDNVVTYTAEDSWGRTTTKTVTYKVRPKAFFNKIQVYTESDKENVAFEIGINNETNKYEVTSYSDDMLDEPNNREAVFNIWIIDSNNRIKESVELLGSDYADSSKLDVINNVSYALGDKIKVWREGDISQGIDTLKITGNIIGQREPYDDGIQDLDNMNNVAFEIADEGFRSVYNEAPVITGVEDKTIYIGDVFNAKDGLVVNDPEDGKISNDKVEVIGTVDNRRIGKYKLVYIVCDSWGRSSLKEVTIHVVSKSTQNRFVFDSNSPSGTNKNLFDIGLDYKTNKYKVDVNSETANEVFDGNNPNEVYARISIYNRHGDLVQEVELLGGDTPNSDKLSALNDITYEMNQTISIYNKNPQNAKVTNRVVNENYVATTEYEDGFESIEEMEKTRFKITNVGLVAIKHRLAEFSGLKDLTITRGDYPNFFDGVTITHPTEEVQETNVEIENFDEFVIGEQTVTYRYTDSWGIDSTATIKVTVNPINQLETNIVELKNNTNNEKIAEILFDTIEMRLKVNINKSALEGLTNNLLLQLNVYNNKGELKSDIEINRNNILDGSIEGLIESVDIEYDDYIWFDSYDNNKGFAINGQIHDQKESYSDGVQNEDYIENVRFIVKENGLTSKYNEKPVFVNLNEMEIFIGDEPDLIEGITVTDDIDMEIDPDNITIDEELEIDTVGKQELTYRVVDSWGREAVAKRTVWVKSLVDNNKAEFYNSNDELLFSIGFDSKTQTYTLTKGVVTGPINPSGGSEIAFNIHVFEEDGSKAYTIPVRSSETLNNSIINLINGMKYQYGRSINIEILCWDNIKFKGVGTYFQSGFENGVSVDYSQFITKENRDYLDNIRIKITQAGIEAIYNKAPVIINEQEGTTLERLKYKTLDKYNLLEGISIYDDKDELSIKDIVITKNGEELTNENANEKLVLGYNEIKYSILDTWGRKSAEMTRTVNISPSIETNVIEFGRMHTPSNPVKEPGFEIGFDANEMKLKTRVINNGTFAWHPNRLVMYTIRLIPSDGDSDRGFNEEILATTRVENIANLLNDKDFRYGDKLTITTTQGIQLKIKGQVLNAAEDYSDGVDYSYIINNTTFTLTQNGFEADVQDSYKDEEGQNTITWLAGFNGLIGIRIILDHNTKTFKLLNPENEHVDTEDRSSQIVFSVKLYHSDGSLAGVGGDFVGRDSGTRRDNSCKTPILHAFGVQSPINGASNTVQEGASFTVGDYIEIRVPKTIRKGHLRISGAMQKDDRIQENYEDGIDDTDFIDNVRFYITEDGLEARYNEAPVITGAQDSIVVKGRDSQIEDVEIEDDWDSREQIQFRQIGSVNNQKIGAYLLTYEATDSWGRSSTFDRFVVVQAPPMIELNEDADLTLELGSMPQNEVDDYLSSLVTITDEEDDRDGNPLDITIDDGGFNPDQVGNYDITYKAVDSDNNETIKTITVNVIRTISVSVPTTIPFQVVTNLRNKEADPFISGVMKVQNNNTSDVNVFIDSFTREDSNIDNVYFRKLEIVSPEYTNDWDNLSVEDSMTKMALGIYNKDSLINLDLTKANPIWLTENMESIKLGVLNRAESLSTPYESKLSFTSKHGKNFTMGRAKGKFNLTFRFE